MPDGDAAVVEEDAGLEAGVAGASGNAVVKCSSHHDCVRAEDHMRSEGTCHGRDVWCDNGECACGFADPCSALRACEDGDPCLESQDCASRSCWNGKCVGNEPPLSNAPSSGGCAGCMTSHGGHAWALVVAVVVVAAALGRRLRSR